MIPRLWWREYTPWGYAHTNLAFLESFRRIWAEVNEQTGAQWRVAQFAMAPLPKAMGGYAKVVGDDERVLGFTVIREG